MSFVLIGRAITFHSLDISLDRSVGQEVKLQVDGGAAARHDWGAPMHVASGAVSRMSVASLDVWDGRDSQASHKLHLRV